MNERSKGIPMITDAGIIIQLKGENYSDCRYHFWQRYIGRTRDPWPAAVNWRAPKLRVQPPLVERPQKP